MRTHFKKNGKKILSLLIAFSFAFGLFNMVACSDSNTTDDNNNGGNTVVQCTHTPCEICGKCTKATCDGEDKCQGHESAPEKKSVSNYFEGVKTTTLKSNITAESGSKSFNYLLDREIDMLTQDILYRLTYVYGCDINGDSYRIETYKTYNLKFDNVQYNYAGSNANVKNTNMLLDATNSNTDLANPNITTINDFQRSIIGVDDPNINGLLDYEQLYLAGAINGRYMSFNNYGAQYSIGLSNSIVNDKQWAQILNVYDYDTYMEYTNKNNMKLAIAQILANNYTSTSIYPQVSRYAVEYSSDIGTLSQANYKDVVLAPKANTPATKLEFTVKSNSSTDTLTMSVERSGATPITKQVTLSSVGQTFTIDINAMSGAKLGAYNGNKAELNNSNMFAGISEYNADGSYKDSDGDNYIKISFTNPSGAEFSISFDGYFDKV